MSWLFKIINQGNINRLSWTIQLSYSSRAYGRSVICILKSPFFCFFNSTIRVRLPEICNLLIERIIQIWGWHQCLDWKENWSDLKSRWPFIFKDIQTNSAKFVDVWVIDPSSEKNFWWDHRIFIRKEKFAVKNTSFIRGFCWSYNLHKEMSAIFLIWFSVNAYYWFCCQSLSFLKNSWWNSHISKN